MAWPIGDPSDPEGQAHIDFGKYNGYTFFTIIDTMDVNYVLWFLAYDINACQGLRRWLWKFFSVLREDGHDVLIVKSTGERFYKQVHALEGGFCQPGLPGVPPPPNPPSGSS